MIYDLLELNPKVENAFRELVSEGRIVIGPFYSQCDTTVIKLESIIRNLEYGKKSYDKFDK